MRDLLIAIAFPLMLPAIAVLHPRHRAVRDSGAILATVTGTVAVAAGIAASVNVDLQPAALFVLGMWWWTIGKMWRTTGALDRTLGAATAALGIGAIAAGLVSAVNIGVATIIPGFPDVPVWTLAGATLGIWLIALGAGLWRAAPAVPSR